MGYGATGRILRVDLTRMHCHTEQLDADVYRLYPGGKALAGYFMLRRHGRPEVTLKLALSLDGCLARPAGGDRWLTGKAARAHCHALRARSDAATST